MELWIWAVIGGLAGTVLMDLTAIAAEKLKITSGGRCGGPQVIGRWVFGTFDGRFVHKNIIEISPVKNEASPDFSLKVDGMNCHISINQIEMIYSSTVQHSVETVLYHRKTAK